MPLLRADKAEVSWDGDKGKWLIRIIVGEEVIRRYSKGPKDADPRTLQADAVETAKEEGYDLADSSVEVKR